ncbi:MAG TPA: NHL repeat-containing protein, partial [Solirubrobacterales bacterium]|nr:NHL repeat-containing protein [Solirubrobacterales bacterium]
NGQLNHPEGVALDSGSHLWVADTGNNRIQELNLEGKYLAQFGSAGSGEEQLKKPSGLAVDASGTVWVSDTENSRIQKLSLAIPPLLVTTKSASKVTESSAVLQAHIEPMGLDASYYFEYGKTTAYGAKVPITPVDAGVRPLDVSQTLQGLSADLYHFRVVATNSAGTARGADETFNSVDTTITSKLPTYADHEALLVPFTSNATGATFKCALDNGAQAVCTSPFAIPGHLGNGWHTFKVAATSPGGATDPTPATWTFSTGSYPKAPASSKLVYPEAGKKTASYYTLKAEWGSPPSGGGVTGITFQWKLPKWEAFKRIPPECVVDGSGQQVSWPLPAASNPGHTEPVFLGARNCAVFSGAGNPEVGIQFRAVFDGGVNAGRGERTSHHGIRPQIQRKPCPDRRNGSGWPRHRRSAHGRLHDPSHRCLDSGAGH